MTENKLDDSRRKVTIEALRELYDSMRQHPSAFKIINKGSGPVYVSGLCKGLPIARYEEVIIEPSNPFIIPFSGNNND